MMPKMNTSMLEINLTHMPQCSMKFPILMSFVYALVKSHVLKFFFSLLNYSYVIGW